MASIISVKIDVVVMSESLLVHLNDASYDAFVKDNKFAVVDFTAPWCGPCKALAPVLEDLAKAYKGKVAFGKLDTQDSPKTAVSLGIMSLPTVLFYKDGKQSDKVTGAVGKSAIESKVKKLIG